MKKWIPFFVVAAVFSACGQKPSGTAPGYVNPAGVQTILMSADDRDQERCATALERQGARVLYRSASGLLFTDRKRAELTLGACQAVVTSNDTLNLVRPSGPVGGTADLPTLLKLIPAETIGARTFVQNHPTYDGRGVVVAVLDTGVELDHPMLRKTPTGEDKIVASHDFSGQGLVTLAAVTAAEGEFTVDGTTYKVGDLPAATLKFGVFPGSSLVYSEDVSTVDVFEDLGVVTYQAADGTWRGKIDTDADGDFTEEAELYDYALSKAFTKIGQGKSLTVNLNVSGNGERASLVFDDGSHGTHVAGIAAGYDPNGLKGVAPGAQVINAKIGDNRLSGGSTTTASMLMAIDFAAEKGAHVINMSYGIRSGSNLGKSAIDLYVDRVAREKGILFSISAGNEGPGLLTIGTPAGAEAAISVGAYLPKDSAHSNYGFVGVTRDVLWDFSSVGPQLDGGWKPNILAPGTALSSIPGWGEGHATYSGTSMAAPQTAGGLALILSGAQQAGLPQDRVSVTRAVYLSAKPVAELTAIQQGHGLLTVPGAFESLKALKGQLPIEYRLSVNSPTAPGGKGRGIYVRSRRPPANVFTVAVAPEFPEGTTAAVRNQLKTYRLVPTAAWIRTPSDFYLLGSARGFRVDLDSALFNQPGLHSERIVAVDEKTGLTAFEVPVTVVVPRALGDANDHLMEVSARVDVGTVSRFFVDLPSGTTSVQWDLVSDGPTVWAQLLDPEGRKVAELRDPDRTAPQPPLLGQANVTRSGVHEIDVVAPPFVQRAVNVRLRLKAFALRVTRGTAVSPTGFEYLVENHFEPLRLSPRVEVAEVAKHRVVAVTGDSVDLPFTVTEPDSDTFTSVNFRVRTAKRIYDLMTDYPYMVFDEDRNLLSSGGLELDSRISVGPLNKVPQGNLTLRITGAFAEKAPDTWVFDLTEERPLKKPVPLHNGSTQLLETGQQLVVPVDLTRVPAPIAAGYANCVTLNLLGGDGRLVQTHTDCP